MEFDSDGVRIHYEVNGPGRGRPIVLVHGFASDYRLNWVGTRWQETLVNAGFRVIGIDCRGHGHSDKPHDDASYDVGLMARDVAGVLDQEGVGSAAYLGYSMGGRIGLQVLLDHPHRITCAVLGGIGASGAMSHAGQIAQALRTGEPSDDPIAQTFYAFASARPANDLHALAACILGLKTHVDPECLAKIRTPVLIVVGDRDEIARGAHALIEFIPTARLVTIADRDHMSAVPAREFKQAALEFLTAED